MKMQSSVTFGDKFLKINMIKIKILQSEETLSLYK